MSKNLETYSLIQEMREDMMACYREVAPNCLTQNGAWRRTLSHPAKRTYITPKQVLQVLKPYFRGEKQHVLAMHPARRRMYLHLASLVEKFANQPENMNKSFSELCRMAVLCPAPEFFREETTIRHIFADIKYKNYDDYGRKK